MSTTFSEHRPACVDAPQVFQHSLLEDPPAPSAMNAAQRHLTNRLLQQAEDKCLSCPLLQQCLHTAVTRHNISGYVAGTTAKQRIAIRAQLGITLADENLDAFIGITSNRSINSDDVIRIRNANPHESLELLAQRLGCSLSTVKRHLRQARNNAQRVVTSTPSIDDVTAAWSATCCRQTNVA
ncbi:MAG: WhiB family transcriptional regulator [Propionibacteriaceae bacterium]